ncbi:MAG: ArsR family transcriptional regulator [DPANN group archaeon]|nr:ArsR family transcriptional regulator [DPANN group archaeon]
MQHLNLKEVPRPLKKNRTKDLAWICESLCLSSGRDTSSIANRVIEKVLEQSSRQKDSSSESIARALNINRAQVNHHLRNLVDMGLLYRHKNRIHIRGGSLSAAIGEIRKDVKRFFEGMDSIAEDVDRSLGLRRR